MLDFLKKDTPITEVFPLDFIDIHSHLLPGIDDGAKNLEESLELITTLDSYGVSNLITTPHVLGNIWPNSSDAILDKLDLVLEALETNNLSHIKIDAAAEYILDEEFVRLLQARDLLTIREDSLLVELPFIMAPVNLYEILFDIQLAGYKPILAHPERYGYFYNDFDQFHKLKEAGCRFQINLLSLTGHYGKMVQKVCEKLIAKNLVDFAGTDTHNMNHLNTLKKIGSKRNLKLLEPILKNNAEFYRG